MTMKGRARSRTLKCRSARCRSLCLTCYWIGSILTKIRDTAWDVAHATLFLANDEVRYITGQELVVDGGLIDATPSKLGPDFKAPSLSCYIHIFLQYSHSVSSPPIFRRIFRRFITPRKRPALSHPHPTISHSLTYFASSFHSDSDSDSYSSPHSSSFPPPFPLSHPAAPLPACPLPGPAAHPPASRPRPRRRSYSSCRSSSCSSRPYPYDDDAYDDEGSETGYMAAVAVAAGDSLAVAAGDRNAGEGMAAAAGCMALGGRRARSGASGSAGWDGSAKARGVVAGAEADRALSGEGGRRLVVVAGCAMAAEGDEAIGEVVGCGLSMEGEGDWGRSRSRCSILALPCCSSSGCREREKKMRRLVYFVSPSLRLLFSSHDRFYG